MSFNKTTSLNGHAKPFIPTSLHRQYPELDRNSFFETPKYSVQSRLNLEVLKRAIASNNAFMLGQKLLELEKDAKNLDLWRDTVGTIWNALRSHHDPTMFLLNVLITIGTISGYKAIDPSFESAISGDMVEVLRRLIDENSAEYLQDQEREDNLSIISIQVPVNSPFLTYSSQEQSRSGTPGFFVDEDFVNSGTPSVHTTAKKSEQLDDLIMLDEIDTIPPNGLPQSILQPIKPQKTEPSLFGNLLDDDSNVNESPNLPHLSVLQPVTMGTVDLIDFSGNEDMDLLSPSNIAISVTTASTGKRLVSPSIDLFEMLSEDNRNEKKFAFDDTQSEFTQQSAGEFGVFEDRGQFSGVGSVEDGEGEEEEEAEVEGEAEEEPSIGEELDEIFQTEPITTTKNEDSKEFSESQENEVRNIIEQRHRDKILKEILNGKCCFQIFLLIDVLEIHDNLTDPIKDADFATGNMGSSCGWLLARQLNERGWFQESSILIFEYLEPLYKQLKHISSTPNTTHSTKASKKNGSYAIPKQNISIYRLPDIVEKVFVDSNERLEQLSEALQNSRMVGMDTEWLPLIEKFDKFRTDPTARTAILQLSCDTDSTVYIVDTIAFLNEANELGPSYHGFIQVIGSLFNNSKILKIAYDWDGDKDLLERTYPELAAGNYQLRNFIDLKYLRFSNTALDQAKIVGVYYTSEEVKDDVISPKITEPVIPDIPSPPSSVGPNSASTLSQSPIIPPTITTAAATSAATTTTTTANGTFSGNTKLRIIPGGLSGMLSNICKYKLDKTQQCSNWEQRPLLPEQLAYAAADAWCLQEIYSAIHTIERVRPPSEPRH